ncbi:hypothetical protein [Rhodococcus tibetensis]|uniref:Uncharacterized protein n=1 Tax=Rhodococcus tibetensis TaxID=2965064 RepID=A0ABT1QCP6_9NOCA|nr:hypothetical protein [Rhodococcus sp. FXJ9.536]MCQ4119972.1 hypothetical protein [Rhodococcus sp. FXJ9.536]
MVEAVNAAALIAEARVAMPPDPSEVSGRVADFVNGLVIEWRGPAETVL